MKVRHKLYNSLGFNMLTADAYVTDGAGASIKEKTKDKSHKLRIEVTKSRFGGDKR